MISRNTTATEPWRVRIILVLSPRKAVEIDAETHAAILTILRVQQPGIDKLMAIASLLAAAPPRLLAESSAKAMARGASFETSLAQSVIHGRAFMVASE